MEANDDRVAAALSGSILAPQGANLVLAEWRDPGGGPALYLLDMTARIAALIEAIHQLETRDEQALSRVFEDHDSELLGWP